jgi:hypothetical protein
LRSMIKTDGSNTISTGCKRYISVWGIGHNFG